jgi:hypothetical protein
MLAKNLLYKILKIKIQIKKMPYLGKEGGRGRKKSSRWSE